MRSTRLWADLLIALGIVLLLLAGLSATEPRTASVRPLMATRQPARLPMLVWATLAPAFSTPASTQVSVPMAQSITPVATVPSTPSPTRLAVTPAQPTATRSSLSTATLPPPPRLEIPKIGLSAAISEVIWRVVETNEGPLGVWDTAETGVGHHRDSAQPGERGNVVLSGHSRGQGSFAQLGELTIGDQVIVIAADGTNYRYRVVETLTVAEVGVSLAERRANARYMAPTEDARLTLITCWPPWAYTHRLIVIARLER